jgi:hypothetical protein
VCACIAVLGYARLKCCSVALAFAATGSDSNPDRRLKAEHNAFRLACARVAYNLSATGPETERARIACDRIALCALYSALQRLQVQLSRHVAFMLQRGPGATPGPLVRHPGRLLAHV